MAQHTEVIYGLKEEIYVQNILAKPTYLVFEL